MDRSSFMTSCGNAFVLNGLNEYCRESIISKLFDLTVRMLEVNSYMNLTRITEMNDIILKHYVDSLTVSKYIKADSKVIDVGCGAGFPSLVLAIARQDIQITALDSTSKRINYINETAASLELSNITGISARAEDAAHDKLYREQYDVACARAVARLNVLAELCMSFVKVGGTFAAMKANYEDELSEARVAIGKLGGELLLADDFELISDDPAQINPRCIISVKKISPSPVIYPRNFSQINKKPL